METLWLALSGFGLIKWVIWENVNVIFIRKIANSSGNKTKCRFILPLIQPFILFDFVHTLDAFICLFAYAVVVAIFM